MEKQRLTIVCQKCKGSRIVDIHTTAVGKRIDWLEDKQPTSFTIISFRERLDGNYGWQCVCGNNSLMTEQERRIINNPASPKPQEIDDIIKNMEPGKVTKVQGGIVVDNFKLLTSN